MGGHDAITTCNAHRRRRPRTFQLAVFVCSWLSLVGTVGAERLPVKAYTTAHGLAHNRVKKVVEDSRGFLWFCTADGLSRFDGQQFTNYTVENGLPGPSINDLLESHDGVYWVATNSVGVVRFDVIAETRPAVNGVSHPRFTVYPISREPATNRVNVLYRDSAGGLWAGTDGGLFRMNGTGRDTAFESVPLRMPTRPEIEAQVWALVEDREGRLWIATKFGLVQRGPDGQTKHFSINPTAVDDVINSLLLDRSGRLWLGHRTGLVVFDPLKVPTPVATDGSSRLTARQFTTHDGLRDNSVLALSQAADGTLWMATGGSYISAFDGTRFQNHHIEHAEAGTNGGLSVGRDNNLWLGTDSAGALKVTARGWINYAEADGLGTAIAAIFENQRGELFVISNAWRVSRFRNPGFETVRVGVPATSSDAMWRSSTGVIQDRAGEWWAASREGVYRFPSVDRLEQLAHVRPVAHYTTGDGLASNDVTVLFEDSRGDMWFGSFGPARDVVTRWERRSGRFHRYSEGDGLQPFTSVQTFAEDAAGNVWLGFREGGVARFRDGRFLVLGRDAGLRLDGINDIYRDGSGRLWLAIHNGGLGRIDAPTADQPRVVAHTRAHGLTTDLVSSVTGDAAGHIYVTSSRGIDRLDPRSGRVKRISAGAGFAAVEFTTSSSDRHGALWFGSRIGLFRLLPQPDEPIVAPPTLVSAVHVSGAPEPVSALGEPRVVLPELDATDNNIQIDFFGIDLRTDEALRYQYRLEGSTGDWTVPAVQRTVNFANLAPGSYRFLVRAVAADGEAGEPATVAFVVLPPIWLRWWFVATVATGMAAGAAVILRARRKRVQAAREADEAIRRSREERLAELERVRKRIATDLHDEIGSSLTRISLLSEVVQQTLGPSEPSVGQSLSSIGGLSRELVDSMSDIVWAINPQKDHLSDLSQRMRHFASDVLTARQIAFRFRTPDPAHDIPVGANVRRELFMMFKEAVNNLVKHSACTQAFLELTVDQDRLVLRVQDDGVGFDQASVSRGHGLDSLRARTEALGGQLSVVTAPGSGTSLVFTISLRETLATTGDPA
jgi:signal transduction histidine kinase/ligand-binding sensor domain-containing protein